MGEESTSKIRIKLSKKTSVIFFAILAILMLWYLIPRFVLPIYTWKYADRVVGFRANLREAQNIPLMSNGPSNDTDFNVRNAIVRDDVKNITRASRTALASTGSISRLVWRSSCSGYRV